MPPAFNLSQDQTLQFKFDLINRDAIARALRLTAEPANSLKVIAKVLKKKTLLDLWCELG
jgi:hypothetical protein